MTNERKSAIKRVIMYKRKIENVLQSWLDDASHKPLVVKGVRQCGKTSSVMDFTQKHFKHVVYLDFREHPDYKKFFSPNLEVDSIIMRITAARLSQARPVLSLTRFRIVRRQEDR